MCTITHLHTLIAASPNFASCFAVVAAGTKWELASSINFEVQLSFRTVLEEIVLLFPPFT